MASNINRKKSKLLPPLLGKKHFCWTGFFETWIRAITQSITFMSKRNHTSIPLPSWCTTSDTQTDRQTELLTTYFIRLLKLCALSHVLSRHENVLSRAKRRTNYIVFTFTAVSGIGRNGTFTANLRFRFFFQIPLQRLFKNHYRKFSDRNFHENPLIFKIF